MGSVVRLLTGEEKKLPETPALAEITSTEDLAAQARTEEEERDAIRRRRSRTRLTAGKSRGILQSGGGQASGLGRVLS